MKTMVKENKAKKKPVTRHTRLHNTSEELETDYPLSEKDEVKKAEQNTQKNTGK